jgi:hypothetical protein
MCSTRPQKRIRCQNPHAVAVTPAFLFANLPVTALCAKVRSQNTYGAIDAKIGLWRIKALPPARWPVDGTDHAGRQSANHRGHESRARAVARKIEIRGQADPFGRKKGGHNRPQQEREHDAYVLQCRRDSRRMARLARAERKARRREREDARRRMEEHARRKARADAGLPYWTEEEWENL